MTSQLINIGQVKLGDGEYGLVRTGGGQAWTLTQQDEPAADTDNLIPYPMTSWHNGALKSRPGIPDSSEYGKNTDGRWPGRLLPSPKLENIWDPNPAAAVSTASPNAIFEAMGYIWFVTSGGEVFRMDSSKTVVKSLTVTLTNGQGGIEFDGKPLVAFEDSTPAGAAFRYLSAIVGGGPDTWTSGTAKGLLLAQGADRAFRIDGQGVLRNCLFGLDPTNESNWADQVQCGGRITGLAFPLPAGLLPYDRSVIAARYQQGVFGVGPEGTGVPLVTPEIGKLVLTRSMHSLGNYAVIASTRGTYRWSPGSFESMGIERELLNESPVVGRITAMAFDGRFWWGILEPLSGGGSDYWLVTFKEDRGSFGPYVIETILHSTTQMRHLLMTTLFGPPTLIVTRANGADAITLGRGGGAPDPFQSGLKFVGGNDQNYRYSNKVNINWEQCDLVKIEVVGRNLVAGNPQRTWRLAYSVDGGAFQSNDINGNPMDTFTNGKVTFFTPRTAVGRDWQFRMEYRGTVDQATPGELLEVIPYFRPRRDKAHIYTFFVRLVDQKLLTAGHSQGSALDQLNDLIALTKPAIAAVETKGPWGDFFCWVRSVELAEVIQEGVESPEFVVKVTMHKREEAA